MTEKQKDLCVYRYNKAVETIASSRLCLENKYYKDSINRSYYAAFYAIKAVLALEDIDFKRHKDVVAYFNQNYVAKDLFDREVGRSLSRLQNKREISDYNDFFVASVDEAKEQLEKAEMIADKIKEYLKSKDISFE